MNSIPLPWPVTAETIAAELALMSKIVARWNERFSSEDFLAELDASPEVERMQLFAQFTNELKVLASKSATLVEVIQ
jgi:hypothetical protein